VLQKSDIVLDAGANIGCFSILASKIASKIIAVEPNPDTFRHLLVNLRMNYASNVVPINVALLDKEGTALLEKHGLESRISNSGVRVRTTTIDKLTRGKVSIIKMDIVVSEIGNRTLIPSYPWLRFVNTNSIQGASAARNYGAKIAKGEILGFLDDDVVLDSHWCEEAVKSLRDVKVGGVSGEAKLPVEAYQLDYIPRSLMWVIGGCYWISSKPIEVSGAAGMNFAVRKELFERVGGYNVSLGPRGDRPEAKQWYRLGAEDTDLALRIAKNCNRIILFNPKMKVLHKLRRKSLFPKALIKRAMHVGRNRAYIHSKYGREGLGLDYTVLTNLYYELANTLVESSKEPILTWKRFSFSMLVLFGIGLGYLNGALTFQYVS